MDLRVTYLREVIPISGMMDMPGPPRRLLITSPGLDKVVDVEINGTRGWSFTVEGSSLIVTLPAHFTIRTIALLGQEMGGLKDAVVHIGFTTHMTDVRGMALLVQNYIKCFLSTPGTDVFSKQYGGGGGRIVGSGYAQQHEMSVLASEAVSRTNKQLMTRQLSDLTIPRSERLASAIIVRSQVDVDSETYLLDIELTNQEGETVRAGLS